MRLLAPAKINLLLSVGARRADGLHELVSVMQSVSLADTLSVEPADELSLEVTPARAAPVDDSNLVVRAARTLATLHGVGRGARFQLDKLIPAGGGLGGGSADAAAALVGLKELWGLSVSRKALEKIGATLGSDVPFCVRGGTAVVRGAGEDLAALAVGAQVWWVLGIAGHGLSTADVYAEFDRLGGGALGDPYEVADALARSDVERLGAALRNDLQQAALSLSPSIADGRDALAAAGAVSVILSGSGPTWLGLARDEAHAQAVASACAGAFERVEVARSLDHGPRVIKR